jgi:hypothetical protein
MSGAVPPLPNTPPWRGAQLKHGDFTFTYGVSKGKRLLLDISTTHVRFIEGVGVNIHEFCTLQLDESEWPLHTPRYTIDRGIEGPRPILDAVARRKMHAPMDFLSTR